MGRAAEDGRRNQQRGHQMNVHAAHGRNAAEIAREIGADACIFQDLDELKALILRLNPAIEGFDDSCFSGRYITGDVDEAYLAKLAQPAQSTGSGAPMTADAGLRVGGGDD